jgi:hypothetical protein
MSRSWEKRVGAGKDMRRFETLLVQERVSPGFKICRSKLSLGKSKMGKKMT